VSHAQILTTVSSTKRLREVIRWMFSPAGVASPGPYKRWVIRSYARKCRTPIFVETGTLYGDTIEAVRRSFSEVYSIEIEPSLAEAAKVRFEDDQRVSIIVGDSATEMATLTARLDSPTLFWLDGHYSGAGTGRGDEDSPLRQELTTVLTTVPSCVVLIDDARFFGTDNGYPSERELAELVSTLRPNSTVEIKRDIVRINAMKPWLTG
jgi:hypothetical protein